MRIHRIVIVAAVACACSATASAFVFVVADPLNIAEHLLLNEWRETLYSVLSEEAIKIGHMAQRLSLFTNLAKYVAPDPPAWRTRRIVPALPASDAYMAAINGGDEGGAGFTAIAHELHSIDNVFARFGEEDGGAENALRSDLATIEIAASAIIVGTDQTGRIRGNRHHEEDVIQAFEDDVVDPNSETSATAVADKVSAAQLIRGRQQETRGQLATALTEQLLVESKRDRDAETEAMNMQLMRLLAGRAVAARMVAGAAEDFRTWRQP